MLTVSQVSWHFRGPLVLKQFAAYIPGSDCEKRSVEPIVRHSRHHGHQFFHARKKEVHEIQERATREQKRGIGDMVTATIDGKVVSWMNEYGGGADHGSPATPTSDPHEIVHTAHPDTHGGGSPQQTSKAVPNPGAGTSNPTANAQSGGWGRQAYYNADVGTADGLVFLNHNGGDKSGVFDMNGLSLNTGSFH